MSMSSAYGGHQSMFVVTSQGVIATDPISYLRPARPYIDAIKAVTDKPTSNTSSTAITIMTTSPAASRFKDLGATFVAHRR